MNYRDYKQFMQKNNRIESVETIRYCTDAAKVAENIKNIQAMTDSKVAIYGAYGVDIVGNIQTLEEKKERLIRKAMKESYDKDWALQTFGRMYLLQIEEMKRNFEAREVSLGILKF